MHKRRLPPAEVSRFITGLEQGGATRIRRDPADARGLVEVRWGDSEVEQLRHAADTRAWRLPILLSGLLAAIIIVVFLVTM